VSMANKVIGKTFNDQELVDTDGERFVDCTFNSAVLVYRGGDHPHFDGCSFGADVSWRFLGPALTTIQFLQRIANDPGGDKFISLLFQKGTYFEE
jgi:hypothetical protein